MKQNVSFFYESPRVDVIEVEVEQGFAISLEGGGENGPEYDSMSYADAYFFE